MVYLIIQDPLHNYDIQIQLSSILILLKNFIPLDVSLNLLVKHIFYE